MSRHRNLWIALGSTVLAGSAIAGAADPAAPAAGPNWGKSPAQLAKETLAKPQNTAIVVKDEDTLVVAGPLGCPCIVIGRTVWDLKTLQPRDVVLAVQADRDTPAAALSPDGKLLVIGTRNSRADEDGNVATIYDTQSGRKVAALQGGEDAKEFEYLGFAGAKDVLLASRTSGSEHGPLDIWDAHTGEFVRRINSSYFRPYDVAVAPDGGHVVVAGEHTVVMYDLATGQKTILEHPKMMATTGAQAAETPMPWRPSDFIDKSGINFSPDGNTVGACDTGMRPTVTLWNLQGQLIDHIAPDEIIGSAATGSERSVSSQMQWSPDGNYCLIQESGLMDLKQRRLIWLLSRQWSTTLVLETVFLDANRLLRIYPPNGRSIPSQIVPIPWDAIHKNQAAMANHAIPAALRPGQKVSLEIKCGETLGDAAAIQKLLQDGMTQRLAQEGLTVADGQATMVTVDFTETKGEETKGFLPRTYGSPPQQNDPVPFIPAAYQIDVSIRVQGQTAAIFHDTASSNGRQGPQGELTTEGSHKAVLIDIPAAINLISIPYYLSLDGRDMLPLGVTTEEAPRHVAHRANP